MALLDTRLLPLIEALVVADADWLAFEVLEGVRQGKVTEEPAEDLEDTRHAVRSAERQTRHSQERDFLTPGSVPIVGDEQVAWAVDYVGRRMSDVVLMIDSALHGLDLVVSGTPHDGPSLHTGADQSVTLVLQTEGSAIGVRRNDLANARVMISRLQEALLVWAASTRNGDIANDQ